MNRLDFARVKYRAIRERLLADEPDLDEETLADTVEGLTDLHEIIAAIMRSALTDEVLASGLKVRIGEMQERFERLAQRASTRRHIARDVMVDSEIKKITAPDFTISLRPGTPSLVVIDETAIPEAYWIAREPRLDRQGLTTDLKREVVIAGVALSNPEPVLSVRAK